MHHQQILQAGARLFAISVVIFVVGGVPAFAVRSVTRFTVFHARRLRT